MSGDIDSRVEEWLEASGARGTTVLKHRRALLDFAAWLASNSLEPFGDHIAEAQAAWEQDMARRQLSEDTVRRRVAAVDAFYDWCSDTDQPLLLDEPADVAPAGRPGALRAAIVEYNARRQDSERLRLVR